MYFENPECIGVNFYNLAQVGDKVYMYLPFHEQELRIEDYEAGRKTGAAASTGFTGLSTSTSTGGLFGNTSGTGFGASSSLIGQKPTTGFGTTGMG